MTPLTPDQLAVGTCVVPVSEHRKCWNCSGEGFIGVMMDRCNTCNGVQYTLPFAAGDVIHGYRIVSVRVCEPEDVSANELSGHLDMTVDQGDMDAFRSSWPKIVGTALCAVITAEKSDE